MRHIDLDFTTEDFGMLLNLIKLKTLSKGEMFNKSEALVVMVITLKVAFDKKLSKYKGEEYELCLGKSEVVGERLYIRGKVGDPDFDHEFDVKTFIDLGFTKEDILVASLALGNDKENVAAMYNHFIERA